MSFGAQTVTFVTVAETGQPGFLGVKAKSRAEVDVPGCHFRTFKSAEMDGEAASSGADGRTRVATEIWKCTAPPEAGVLAAKSTGEIKYKGMTFQIEGPIELNFDMGNQVHHVTIFAKRQVS